MGPMTMIVILVLVAALLAGIGIIYRALTQDARASRERACRHCRSKSPGHAKFCAHCGKPFGSD